jgi:hypothetical protein
VLVGVAGFEPATPSSRTRCATKVSVLNLLGPSGRGLASFVADNASFVSAAAAQRRRRSVDRNVNANRKLKGPSRTRRDVRISPKRFRSRWPAAPRAYGAA